MQKCSTNCSWEAYVARLRPEANPDIAGVGVCIIATSTHLTALFMDAEA